ncbi:L,D-transpeptidase scaffold domain-containing protein [Pontibacter rugosus]
MKLVQSNKSHMNPFRIKNITLGFMLPLSAALLLGCGDGNSSKDGGKGITDGLFGGKELPQATTDSLFIKKYISDKKEFKEFNDLMFLFYGERDYSLAWFRNNELVPETEKFINVVNKASKEGLNPASYKVVDLEQMIQKYKQLDANDSTRLALQEEIDVALTASYFNYASDFYRGRANPQLDAGSSQWDVKRNKIKLHKALQTILKERDSTYPYYEFEALHAGYTRLRDKLQEYRALEAKGGWPKIELGNRKVLEQETLLLPL